MRRLVGGDSRPVHCPAAGGGYDYAHRAPGAETHDGFYLRLAIGPASPACAEDDADITVKGVGGPLALSLGDNMSRDLILYRELLADTASDPTIRWVGRKSTARS